MGKRYLFSCEASVLFFFVCFFFRFSAQKRRQNARMFVLCLCFRLHACAFAKLQLCEKKSKMVAQHLFLYFCFSPAFLFAIRTHTLTQKPNKNTREPLTVGNTHTKNLSQMEWHRQFDWWLGDWNKQRFVFLPEQCQQQRQHTHSLSSGNRGKKRRKSKMK